MFNHVKRVELTLILRVFFRDFSLHGFTIDLVRSSLPTFLVSFTKISLAPVAHSTSTLKRDIVLQSDVVGWTFPLYPTSLLPSPVTLLPCRMQERV